MSQKSTESKKKRNAKYNAKRTACFRAFSWARSNKVPSLAKLYMALPDDLKEQLDNAFREDD